MIKSINNARCSGAQQNEFILMQKDELLGSDLTPHGPRRKFIKCVSRIQRGRICLLLQATGTVTVAVTFGLTVSQSVRLSGAHDRLLVKEQD
jgi:hypothetical protein